LCSNIREPEGHSKRSGEEIPTKGTHLGGKDRRKQPVLHGDPPTERGAARRGREGDWTSPDRSPRLEHPGEEYKSGAKGVPKERVVVNIVEETQGTKKAKTPAGKEQGTTMSSFITKSEFSRKRGGGQEYRRKNARRDPREKRFVRERC